MAPRFLCKSVGARQAIVFNKYYDQSEQGITVPYAPLFNDINRNHGFVDVRGRPDLVAGIPEASQSNALGVCRTDTLC